MFAYVVDELKCVSGDVSWHILQVNNYLDDHADIEFNYLNYIFF